MKSYSNIAALEESHNIVGHFVEVDGYYSAGDAAGRMLFLVSSSGTADGYVNHEDAAGNILILQNTPITFYHAGAKGDNATDDAPTVQALFTMATAGTAQKAIHISEGSYYFADKLTLSKTTKITCEENALMRWDGDEDHVGIFFDFESVNDTLTSMEFPQMFGPAIASTISIPGYSTREQDGSTRVGTGLHVYGSNRIDIRAQVVNGFENACLVQSTPNSTCDNVNITINTSDFCEKCFHLDSTLGYGIAQFVGKVNTCWSKFPIYINASSGYLNAININVEGTSFVNEVGGCGVYALGTNIRSSGFYFNQIQAGYRSDSPLDTPVILTPTGTMSATPIEGETIIQSSSGASGVVVTNADYTLGTTIPFTVQDVSGTFDTTGQLVGSVSGALGAGSIPSTVRGLVCPWLGGNQSSNSKTYDGEQTGTIGYFGGKHCSFEFGPAYDHPTGVTSGAFSNYPVAGESVRIRDAGRYNRVRALHTTVDGADNGITAIALSSTIGEANFDGGVGSAKFANTLYCSASVSALAAGAQTTFYLYHSQLNYLNTLQAVSVQPKNEGLFNNGLRVVAYSQASTENRRIAVRVINDSASPVTATIYFFVNVV